MVAESRRDQVKVSVEGIDELLKDLRSLPIDLQKKLEKKAIRKALKPIEAEAKDLAPVGRIDEGASGKPLKESFAIRVRTTKGQIIGSVVNEANHSWLVENGHNFVAWQTGRVGKRIDGTPFLGPALVSQAQTALNIFAAESRKIMREFEKRR
ncbi:MAG: hypothetical protein GTN64_05455 [Candidatus Latescibacteria bacterium]|nr:hypothetical protein [Candidatus Latescibacterota bacterium]NIO78056.1 hypothetical protein [Candidatus Latescibacterota bacterium]